MTLNSRPSQAWRNWCREFCSVKWLSCSHCWSLVMSQTVSKCLSHYLLRVPRWEISLFHCEEQVFTLIHFYRREFQQPDSHPKTGDAKKNTLNITHSWGDSSKGEKANWECGRPRPDAQLPMNYHEWLLRNSLAVALLPNPSQKRNSRRIVVRTAGKTKERNRTDTGWFIYFLK